MRSTRAHSVSPAAVFRLWTARTNQSAGCPRRAAVSISARKSPSRSAIETSRVSGAVSYTHLFTSAAALVANLAKAHVEGRLEDRLTQWAKPKLLIIDELGYLPFEPHAAHLFFQLVARRYERGSLLLTSNRSVGEWASVFGLSLIHI